MTVTAEVLFAATGSNTLEDAVALLTSKPKAAGAVPMILILDSAATFKPARVQTITALVEQAQPAPAALAGWLREVGGSGGQPDPAALPPGDGHLDGGGRLYYNGQDYIFSSQGPNDFARTYLGGIQAENLGERLKR